LRTAGDTAVLEYARENGYVVVPADTDFGTLLDEGAVVVLEDARVRVRRLPLL